MNDSRTVKYSNDIYTKQQKPTNKLYSEHIEKNIFLIYWRVIIIEEF